MSNTTDKKLIVLFLQFDNVMCHSSSHFILAFRLLSVPLWQEMLFVNFTYVIYNTTGSNNVENKSSSNIIVVAAQI